MQSLASALAAAFGALNPTLEEGSDFSVQAGPVRICPCCGELMFDC